MIFFFLLVSLFAVIVAHQVRFAFRSRMRVTQTWDQALASVAPVDIEGLRVIVAGYLESDRGHLPITSKEMFELVGGLRGIQHLKTNAKIMLSLAISAERWNCEQGRVISNLIRQDAVRLNKAIFRLELALFFHMGFVRGPFDLKYAASSYDLIRSRLLELYQQTHAGLVPRLEAAL